MKKLEHIQNKIRWEKYYDPDFNWMSINWQEFDWKNEEFLDLFKDNIPWEQACLEPNCLTSKMLVKYAEYVKPYLCWVVRFYEFTDEIMEYLINSNVDFLNEPEYWEWDVLLMYQVDRLSKSFFQKNRNRFSEDHFKMWDQFMK